MTRTDEEIQIVFDRYKSALYRLYNRELRQDPTLEGQMVLRLTIQPDGSCLLCEVKSTDMKAPQLAQQVVDRVKTFDFGAKPGIPAVTIALSDRLPAGHLTRLAVRTAQMQCTVVRRDPNKRTTGTFDSPCEPSARRIQTKAKPSKGGDAKSPV